METPAENPRAQELYVSVDIETDGPSPSAHSLISLGAVAFDHTGKEISAWEGNMIPMGVRDAATMEWWKKHPEAWRHANKDQDVPTTVMNAFVGWTKMVMALASVKKVVAMAQPAGYDWPFVYYYLQRYANENPYGFQCIDIKTAAMMRLGKGYRGSSKREMPTAWLRGLPAHTHKAVEDARGQGMLFFRIRDWPLDDK